MISKSKKKKRKKEISLKKKIYPLIKLTKKEYQITDHVNLSGENPLKGPKFISLTNLYVKNKKLPGLKVAILKEGVIPTKKEKTKLVKVGIKGYCYDLAEDIIYAAFLGLKVNAKGIVRKP